MAGDNISQIKDRLSVVDVISSYIKVNKAGANFKARCPFHNEKTPSFYISPERQIWHCFGCAKGGDIFGFIKEIEGVEFGEALRILAQRAGVELDSFDPTIRDAKSVLYEISETASRFFEKQLHHSPVGKQALAYLKERGLADGTIKEFRLGFAPEGWHNLSLFLRDCGYKDKDVIDTGLSLKKEDGSDMYDRFRSRIIFPIADLNDQVVAFAGRVFGDNHPADVGKYINSPQTLIYDKSRILYGLNKAKIEARKADRCLLVEGNIDVIMSYQAGVKNVAATSGTALTPSHLQLLQRYTNNLDFCFDIDQAGLAATRRGIGLALSQNLDVKIINLQDPECKDPADYVKKFGQRWHEVVQTAKPVIDFYFDKLKSEVDIASVEGKKAIVLNLGPLIKRLSSRVERSHWISKLAAVMKVKEEAIEADIISVRDDLDSYENYKVEEPKKQTEILPNSQEDLLSEALLAVIVKKPSLFRQELDRINNQYLDGETIAIIAELKNADFDNFSFDNFAQKFEQKTRMKLEFAYLKSQELLKDFSDEDLKNEFLNIVGQFERKSVTSQLASLEMDIREAETEKNKFKIDDLLSKFSNLTKKLK